MSKSGTLWSDRMPLTDRAPWIKQLHELVPPTPRHEAVYSGFDTLVIPLAVSEAGELIHLEQQDIVGPQLIQPAHQAAKPFFTNL